MDVAGRSPGAFFADGARIMRWNGSFAKSFFLRTLSGFSTSPHRSTGFVLIQFHLMNIVTGMHRSGTSVVAALLHDLGADFGDPRNLMQKDQWNAEGYFEDVHVVSLNDALVLGDYERAQGFFAGGARRAAGFQPIWTLRQMLAKARYFLPVDFPKLHRRAEALGEVMRQTADAREDLWVKDPRFCLTLQEWLGDAVSGSRIVISFRHPEEVAGSLLRRDRCPRVIGRRLWREHNARILQTCSEHGLQPWVVSFRNLFDPETGLDEMRLLFAAADRAWDEDLARDTLEKRVNRDLRHHDAPSPKPHPTDASIYALLEDRRRQMLDQLRRDRA
jgi:hypothetical protein